MENDSAERTALIGILAETFRQTASKPMLTGYAMGLEGIPTDRLKAAVRTALRTCKFMPTPIELRELAGELKITDRAVRAFMAMAEAVTGIGGYSTIDFDDRFINATIRALGGWVSVCETPADEFDKFLKQKFERTYAALVAAGVSAEQAAPLQGRHDRDNAIGGYQRQPIREITTGLPPLPNNPPRLESPPERTGSPLLILRKQIADAQQPKRLTGPSEETKAAGDALAKEIEAKRAELAKQEAHQ